ncbi:nuclear transport factor 2 family protein [Streptomyces sp. NBC_01803]|uniref:nuclear transport factor 2 family protein n=1 Tax=Streptomyces sp. NBC_01803 TaxID=2975946 RepID=UPI002DD7B847|nr:nuclear transport factor 2 family protein [Streptomyces sp. NBC_01803]WSA47284.1 nuclear transport factor 2 family protein [Streptomyces sp. NBC_01803]
MSQLTTNIDCVHAAYAAFRERDVNALLAVLTPDVEWVHPEGMDTYGLGGTELGHTGVREFLAKVATVLGGMRLEPKEFFDRGDRVVVFGTRQVTSLSGHTATLDFVHSWTMRDGRAARMEDIFDTVLFQRLIES